ncbi:MAG TPA: alpha/beta hydrolase [Hanamia sp.]|nr:alpha/beta hydrolase [Hanamia sp.]
MKHIYSISGFGADERVFSKLDFGENEAHFIPWIIPEKNESIASYAKRMQKDILHPNPVLVGLSFGGMMSIEIAKRITVEKVILISSICTSHELPLYMKIAGKLRLNRMIPMKPYPILEPLENYNLGVKTKEQKILLKEYRKNLNLQYSNWAMNQVVNWKNEWIPPDLVHIHGTKDHIFPIRYIHNPDYIIKGGGHFISMNNSEEMNEILKKIL